MSVECFICKGPVNPHDEGTWKQVIGWVHGKRKDGMTLRMDTGAYAHSACVEKLRAGQAADQDDIFSEAEKERFPLITYVSQTEAEDLAEMKSLLEENE